MAKLIYDKESCGVYPQYSPKYEDGSVIIENAGEICVGLSAEEAVNLATKIVSHQLAVLATLKPLLSIYTSRERIR